MVHNVSFFKYTAYWLYLNFVMTMYISMSKYYRLVMMSESSLKIWKLKMASDICDEKNEIISEIEKLTQYTRNANSGKAYNLITTS